MSAPFPRVRAFHWKKTSLLLLDQRQLPHKTRWQTCRTWQQVAKAIGDMVVRGAPAIGCTAAYGVVLAAKAKRWRSPIQFRQAMQEASTGLLTARPTAVNLSWALDQLRPLWEHGEGAMDSIVSRLEREAIRIETDDRKANQAIGRLGAALLPSGATILTHCNTGSLATAGLGTAFGVIWTAFQEQKIRKVIASETRPYLQGARLTAWELQQERIPFELITDNMAAHVMQTEPVHAVIVGADRIAANGDTANKIGTYGLAVLAAYHEIAFYVAAPMSTIDRAMPSGAQIPIEERPSEEVTSVRGQAIAPEGTRARHPAFDVTPAELIAGIITERGVARPPYGRSLKKLFEPSPSPAREPALI